MNIKKVQNNELKQDRKARKLLDWISSCASQILYPPGSAVNISLNSFSINTQVEQIQAKGHCNVKDGAYYCYCAYFLRISRYSGFLLLMPTKTVIFLCGLKLSGESRS